MLENASSLISKSLRLQIPVLTVVLRYVATVDAARTRTRPDGALPVGNGGGRVSGEVKEYLHEPHDRAQAEARYRSAHSHLHQPRH